MLKRSIKYTHLLPITTYGQATFIFFLLYIVQKFIFSVIYCIEVYFFLLLYTVWKFIFFSVINCIKVYFCPLYNFRHSTLGKNFTQIEFVKTQLCIMRGNLRYQNSANFKFAHRQRKRQQCLMHYPGIHFRSQILIQPNG